MATATSLFDLRAIAGDAGHVKELVATFMGRERSRAGHLARALAEDTKKRHDRYGDSIYLLEPEVKLGAGGLRDLDVARWLLATYVEPGRDPLEALVEHAAVDARDLAAALAAEAFHVRVRNRLHALAKRRADRLTFDAQEALAREIGYGEDEPAIERFMQDHYVHARAVSRVHGRAVSLTLRPRGRKDRAQPLGDGLVRVGEAVAFAPGSADAMAKDPAIALRAYEACVRYDAPIDEATRDAISRTLGDPAVCAALRASSDAASCFVSLLSTVGDVPALGTTVARELHDTGLLLAMIPEFLPVTGRVHHDVYHVLTVDVHSVAAVDCLRDLARGELAANHPLASRLAAEIAQPRPLFLATLLHDIGKGHGGAGRKNHSTSGAVLCDVILPRLGFSAEETADARALVQNHLVMYHLATRRDLDDAATVEELCRVVRGREGLRDLYLLTVADITTTSPLAMTSWKAHMLEELFLRAEARLAGAPLAIDAERLAAVKDTALSHDPDARAFVESMPRRYLLATPAPSIAAHARLARSRGDKLVVLGLGSQHASRAEVEVCVVARDRHGLLARIAAALACHGLEVSAAFINTRSVGDEREAVDVFFVRGEAVEKKLPAVERDLAELCADRVSAPELIASRLGPRAPWAVRKTPDVRTHVSIDERTSHHSTIIEVSTKDEPGLLFRLAQALEESGASIVLSKINTEGTKVADVFYVQERDGRKVEGKERLDAIRDRLLARTH
jgi:[protein-PII] uridylyltransferase